MILAREDRVGYMCIAILATNKRKHIPKSRDLDFKDMHFYEPIVRMFTCI